MSCVFEVGDTVDVRRNTFERDAFEGRWYVVAVHDDSLDLCSKPGYEAGDYEVSITPRRCSLVWPLEVTP